MLSSAQMPKNKIMFLGDTQALNGNPYIAKKEMVNEFQIYSQ